MWRILPILDLITRNEFCWNGLDHLKSSLLKLETRLFEDVDDFFQKLPHWCVNELFKSALRDTLSHSL